MKLASRRGESRDGQLLVVSRDLTRAAPVPEIAPNLQAALDGWVELAPLLESASEKLNGGSLPGEIGRTIGTSTLLAAWNAAVYVAQIEDDRLAEAMARGNYLDATGEVLARHGGLWFNDETFVIKRQRG